MPSDLPLSEQAKGDGDAGCFTSKTDTGIPALQSWCHELTVASRERAARVFLKRLSTFLKSIRSYVDEMEGVSLEDRISLREMWQSEIDDDSESGVCSDDEDEAYAYRFNLPKPFRENPRGVAIRLAAVSILSLVFSGADSDHWDRPCPRSLIRPWRTSRSCSGTGWRSVARPALKRQSKLLLKPPTLSLPLCTGPHIVLVSSSGHASYHFLIYTPALRRHGEFRQNLNAELIHPLTKEIASSWAKVFEADLFGAMEKAASNNITTLIKEIETSAPKGLADRCKAQGDVSLDEAKVAMEGIMVKIRERMTSEQKEISRCLEPHVRVQLADGYDLAMEERGRGSVARQKVH